MTKRIFIVLGWLAGFVFIPYGSGIIAAAFFNIPSDQPNIIFWFVGLIPLLAMLLLFILIWPVFESIGDCIKGIVHYIKYGTE